MFQYLRTIVRASCNFEGTAWVSYDVAFRRQAAAQGSFNWGTIDATLYNEAFTGRARIRSRCTHCLADTHSARSCSMAPEEWQPRQKPDTPTPTGGIPLCGLFNSTKGNSCGMPLCPYLLELQTRVTPSLTVSADSETPAAGSCPLMTRVLRAILLTALPVNSHVIICPIMLCDY